MATRKTATTKAIDPKQLYDVVLSAPITVGRTMLRPRDKQQLLGSHVTAHLSAVASYTPVKPATGSEDS